jgi:hypothetical protein
MVLAIAGYATSAQAQHCHREGADVVCDDGHRGVWSSEAITWADGTRSLVSSSERCHRQQIVGHHRARRLRRSRQGLGAARRSQQGALRHP